MNIDPWKDLAKHETGYSSKSDSSSSVAYDHSGADLAHKYGSELQSMQAAHSQALMNDPMSALATGKRIGQLQRYLSAYKGGYNLPDQEVLPAARVARSESSQSSSAGGDTGVTFYDPQRLLGAPRKGD
jgi:hypothetical protein